MTGPWPAASIIETIGRTPIVRLGRLFGSKRFFVHAKLEGSNPGGSAKDRTALQMITEGMRAGHIGPGTVIVESSSGNLGIGLAQVCAYFGLRFICVIDAKTTRQHRRILRAYGAEIDCVDEPDPRTGEYLAARLERVRSLVRRTRHAYWPNQYANLANPRAHYRTLMPEVMAALGRVDYLFCATSTCGTLVGCERYVRDHKLATTLVAVDARGSVLFGRKRSRRLVPGHGAAVRPALRRHLTVERVIHVSDVDCIVGCRRLVRSEGILAGGSAGGVLTAIERASPEIPDGAVCVAILHDTGERYLETVFSDAWVRRHFGRGVLRSIRERTS